MSTNTAILYSLLPTQMPLTYELPHKLCRKGCKDKAKKMGERELPWHVPFVIGKASDMLPITFTLACDEVNKARILLHMTFPIPSKDKAAIM